MVFNSQTKIGSFNALGSLVRAALLIVPLAFFHPAYNSIKGLALLFFVFCGWLIFALKGIRFIRSDWSRVLPFIFFWLSALISLPGHSGWFRGLETISLEFAFLGFFLIAGRALAEENSREKTAFLAIIPAGIIAGIGILQWFGVLPVPLDRYGHEDLASLFGLSNYASDYLVVIVPLAFWGLFFGNRNRAPALAVTFLGLAYMIFCQNRTAWVALGASFPVCVILLLPRIISRQIRLKWSDFRVWGSLAAISGVFLILLFSGTGFSSLSRMRSISHFQEASIAYRINLWDACLELSRQHPVRGVGVGNLEVSVPTVWNRELENMAVSQGLAAAKAHNYYLQVLAERGWLGVLGLLWLLFSVGAALRRRLRSAENERDFFWFLGIAGGLIAGLVGSVFSFVLSGPASGMAFWFLAALLAPARAPEKETTSGALSRFPAGLGVLLAGFFLFWFSRYAVGGTYELKGLEAVIRDQKAQAIFDYDRALRIYPYLPISLERRARLSLEAGGDLESAVTDLEKSQKFLPNQVRTHELLSQVLAREGRYPDAARELEKALRLLRSPAQRARLLVRLTGYFVLGGDPPRALEYGVEAVNLNPADPAGHFYFGLANLFSERPETARIELLESVRGDPNSAWSWYYLGSAYFKSGMNKEGEKAWQRSRALDSGMNRYTDRNNPQAPDWLSLR